MKTENIFFRFGLLFAVSMMFAGCEEKPEEEDENNGKGEWVIINGVKWTTRNVDTHGHFVAKPEDFGGLFQWGRKGDGHENRNSSNYPTNNNSFEEGFVSAPYLDANGQVVNTHAAYGKFIKNSYLLYDWRSPQNNALWNTGSETSPVKSANDPCPPGWRLPTLTEFEKLVNSGSRWTIQNGVYGRLFGSENNSVFLPSAGLRGQEGDVRTSSFRAVYWSSSAGDPGYHQSAILTFDDDFAYAGSLTGGNPRVFGSSCRCVAE